MSGFIVEAIGFRSTTMVFVPIYLLAIVGNLFELANTVRKSRKTAGYEPIK